MIVIPRFGIAIHVLLLVAGLLAACSSLVPATAPPQLQHTPGAYIIISNGHVKTSRYQLEYPKSWQLVKQSASDADNLQLDLIAPDGGRVTLLEVDSAGAAERSGVIPLAEDSFVQVIVYPADESDAAFASQVEQLVSSIRK